MLMLYAIIAAIIWIIGIFVSYFCIIKKWDSHKLWGKIYLSIIWPLLIPLYIIHWIHNAGK